MKSTTPHHIILRDVKTMPNRVQVLTARFGESDPRVVQCSLEIAKELIDDGRHNDAVRVLVELEPVADRDLDFWLAYLEKNSLSPRVSGI